MGSEMTGVPDSVKGFAWTLPTMTPRAKSATAAMPTCDILWLIVTCIILDLFFNILSAAFQMSAFQSQQLLNIFLPLHSVKRIILSLKCLIVISCHRRAFFSDETQFCVVNLRFQSIQRWRNCPLAILKGFKSPRFKKSFYGNKTFILRLFLIP